MTTGMEKASTVTIWAELSDRLRGFIAKRVQDETEVQDILQEVFTKIHAGLGNLKESEKLEAWLFQVARRAILDHFRSRGGKRRAAELPEDLPGMESAVDLSAEVASWLAPLMDLIPEDDRIALRLADLEGVSRKEVARRLGLSASAAKSRVQRARKRLKKALLECCHIEMDRRGNPIDYTWKGGSCGDCSCS
jgi:RNA polymerase sigma-70 factor, ECF subfamily